jgi:hypothetical protein
MLNVIDNRLRSIKHMQNKKFGGVDVFMTCDFYQTSFVGIIGSFKILKTILMH